ncbi:MAG: divergent PAP2 family protein, partial [Anaerolineae bacterium]|nr:divergent PAP2 family protein [Anaerolineae bacterium]
MSDEARTLWQNLQLWLPVVSGLLVQAVKFLGNWARHRRPDFRVLIQAGGMPSSHAAVVCSLATAVGLRYGWGSTIFAV